VPLAALALVLASAAVHAVWNTLLSSAEETDATAAVSLLAGAALLAPIAALTWDVDGAALPFAAASAALELAYFALLAAAYARADLSFVYPLARGSAPVLVLAVSVAALGAPTGAAQVAGVAAVVAGILLVRGVGRRPARGAPALALGVGACIAGYTLVDDRGVQHAAALPYFALVLAATALPYAAVVAARRGPGALRRAAGPRALLAGAGMAGAYALALAALELADPAPVAALRETSVVMATLGAALLGREAVPARRLAGAAVVVAGAAAIALG
jgi:drug/metabolite transporter (DMT)-like permease